MFDIMTGISQQELTHDKGHTPQGSLVASHVSCSLSFPSQRLRYRSLLKYRINLSGVEKFLLGIQYITAWLSKYSVHWTMPRKVSQKYECS